MELKRNNRIEYLDALRGVTMIMVVVYHVSALYLGVSYSPENFHYYIAQIRMPLFFFVSGFVLYKASFVWDFVAALKYLGKKFPIQILFPFIVFCIYVYIRDLDFTESITNLHKAGYWFTFTLFTYYIIYALIQYIFHKYKIKKLGYISLLYFVIGIFLYYNGVTYVLKGFNIPQAVIGFLGTENMLYFIFFLLGTIVRKYFPIYEKILDKSYTILICISIFLILNLFVGINSSPKAIQKIYNLILSVSGITTVFALFRSNKNFFCGKNYLSKGLIFIGRRTLDIYLFHFFFLYNGFINDFPILHKLAEYPLIEFFISFVISLLVILVSIVIGSIIRLAPPIAMYCFGVKNNSKI